MSRLASFIFSVCIMAISPVNALSPPLLMQTINLAEVKPNNPRSEKVPNKNKSTSDPTLKAKSKKVVGNESSFYNPRDFSTTAIVLLALIILAVLLLLQYRVDQEQRA